MKKLLAIILTFGLMAGIGFGTIGCSKKEGDKKDEVKKDDAKKDDAKKP